MGKTRKNGKSRSGSKYSFPRRFSRAHCMRKTCKKMGFTEKASCRPYKNCYRKVKYRI